MNNTGAEESPGAAWRARILAIAFVVIATVALLWVGATRSYFMRQVIGVAFLYGILAISIDLAWGYTGILSMGHAVFFGLGGYAVGLVTVDVTSTGVVALKDTQWWTFPSGLVLGIIAAAVVASIVSVLAFSGKSSTPFYVSVVTLALTLILGTVLQRTLALGGQQGLSGFPIAGIGPAGWYWIAAFSLIGAGALAYVLVRSDFGLLLKAIRDNENRCRYLGFNVPRAKLAIFAGSGALAALAGALYGGYIGFVSPPFVGFLFATQILIWAAVGGRGTLIGPVLGAIGISLIGSQLSASFPFLWTLILGLLFVAVVAFIPDGVFPALAKLSARAVRVGRGRVPSLAAAPKFSRELVIAEPSLGDAARVGLEDGLALSIRDLHRGFGGLKVLRGVSLDIRRAELICIVGPNGAGKTTLLGVLSDGSVPHEGSIELRLNGQGNLRGLEPKDIVRKGIGRKFQAPNLFDSLTVAEVLLLAGRRGAVPSIWRRSKATHVTAPVYRIMEAAGLLRHVDTRVADLPHGLKQALEVAATVALQPEILLLDEPTAGLTREERNLIGDLLRHIVEERGITVVLIEHDFEFVRRIADRIAVLHDGRVLALGTVSEVADSDVVRRAYLGVEV